MSNVLRMVTPKEVEDDWPLLRERIKEIEMSTESTVYVPQHVAPDGQHKAEGKVYIKHGNPSPVEGDAEWRFVVARIGGQIVATAFCRPDMAEKVARGFGLLLQAGEGYGYVPPLGGFTPRLAPSIIGPATFEQTSA